MPPSNGLFETYTRSAFRLETRQIYNMPNEQENFNKFLRGEPYDDMKYSTDWRNLVSANIAAGKTMQRAKLVRRPYTDYTRWLLTIGVPRNTKAGEDYRIVDITDRELDLPDLDFWLFDESTVLLLHFNDDNTLRDREVLENPPDLAKYLAWRDYALEHSVPFSEYSA
ncbi:hypothetical protein Lesp02_64150 [Lentzea sp. NBRC 105346]|nr:hypothetical protein Lesp02_64150 [Lentzea sp. NBRC 105346]